ncbi:ABC transporter ATP-binding protein [Proteiniborus sp.]|uniref:ABC transporter ATP-binding protein n=1 Tax=Proteiniborus sp. TaxID=2079015 RepID=UPI00331E565C
MKDLLLKRKSKFIMYVIACFLPVIDTLLRNVSIALLIGSIEVKNVDYFIKVFALSIFFSLFGTLLYVISRFMRISYMRDTILDVRINAFDRILKYSYKNFSKKSKDIYISNLINDINVFEQNFFLKLINTIFQGGWYVVSLIILFFMDFKFALGIFTISILMFFISKSFENKTVKLQEEVSENNENFTTNISNTFNGLEILKLNNIEEKFLQKTLKAVDKVERKKLHYTVFTEGQRSLTNFLGFAIFIGIILYSIKLVLQGESFTKIMLMIQLSNGCVWPIVEILPWFNELKASAKIYDKITQNDEERNSDIVKEKEFTFNSQLEVSNLKFSYDNKEIFNGASFIIEKGKKYLLKGASGAGKSTLINLLSMVNDDYEGTIKLDDVDYKEINEKSFNDNISFVYQDVFLFEDTIYNNIALFKNISEERVLKAAKDAGLMDFLNERKLGLQEKLMENGKNLSGGQRQRISIARAIAKDASILFVDEATSSLNEELGRAIENTLLSLDSTVIAISHRYYEGISEKYDYVLEVKNGLVYQYNSQDYFNMEVLAI